MLPAIATTNPAPADKRHIVHLQSPARGRAHRLGIVGERILRLGNAHRQPAVAPFGVLGELWPRLVAEDRTRCAVNLHGDFADLFFERIFQRVDGLNVRGRDGLDQVDDFLGQIDSAGSAPGEGLDPGPGRALPFALGGDRFEFFCSVLRERLMATTMGTP